MDEYPESLVEKVAQAAYERAFLKHAPEYVDRWDALAADNDPAAESWREIARAAFDALGLAEERQGPRFYKDSSSSRFVTKWVSLD